MSDTQAFVLVFFILYLGECFSWIQRNSLMFRLSLWPVKNPGFAGEYLGNQRGGLVFDNPLPPLGSVFISQPWPVSLSPHGVFSYISQVLTGVGRPPQPSLLFRYEDIDSVETRSEKIYINNQPFVSCPSGSAALLIADKIKKLKKSKPRKREEILLKAMAKTLDIDGLKQVIADFSRSSRMLRILTNLSWGYFFILTPLILWLSGARWLVWLLAAGFLLLHLPVLIFFYRLHRKFYPGFSDDRFTQLVRMLLFPPAALRACDAVSVNLLHNCHPIAAAFVLCTREQFSRFARKLILDLQFPINRAHLTTEQEAVADWHRQRQLRLIQTFLKDQGIEMEKLLEKPAFLTDADDVIQAYCPRCRTPYIIPHGTCSDCWGVTLTPIHSSPA